MRVHRVWRVLGWTGLLAVLSGAVAALLRDRFYYGNDDLLQFVAARDYGLSWPLLSLNVFQHFGPYDRFGHWLVVDADLSLEVGLALALINLTGLLAACLWLMTELRLSTTRRTVALIVIAFTAPTTESTIWFDAAMHILPAIAITIAICAAHVRAVRTSRLRWHVVAFLLFLLGPLIQERPVLALPVLVLVDVLLLWRDLPWAFRLRRLWQLRGPLAALAVAAGVVAAGLQAFVVVDAYATPSWSVTGRHALMALTDYVVPSLANQWLDEPAGVSTELFMLAAIVGVGLLLASAGRHNAGPLLFAAAVFALYYGFLKFSTMLNEAVIEDNAERLQNAIYATVPATIALAHLRLTRIPFRRQHSGAPGRAPLLPMGRGLRAAGCLALAGYLLVSNVAYLDRRWAETTEAHVYLEAVRGSASAWSAPGTTVLPLRGHPAMATGWSRPLSRHDVLLPLINRNAVPGAAGSPILLDNRGVVRPAALEMLRSAPEVIAGDCGASPRHPFVDKAGLYFPAASGEPLFLRLRYRAVGELDVQVSGGWGRVWTRNSGPTRLLSGEHTRLVPLDATLLESVDLQVLTDGGALCIESAAIVRAVLVEERACRAVDWFGTPGRRVACP